MFKTLKLARFKRETDEVGRQYLRMVARIAPDAKVIKAERADKTGDGVTFIRPETDAIVAWTDYDYETKVAEFYILTILVFRIDYKKMEIWRV